MLITEGNQSGTVIDHSLRTDGSEKSLTVPAKAKQQIQRFIGTKFVKGLLSRITPLLDDFVHVRVFKLKCEKSLTLPENELTTSQKTQNIVQG